MEQADILLGHIRDLSRRAFQNDYLTHSFFLSESELAMVYAGLRKEGADPHFTMVNGAACLSYGGYEDAERRVLVFLPSYMDKEGFFLMEQQESSVIALLHVTPKNVRFSEPLSHRDYLGSLMQLGLEREQIGDILVGNRTEEPDSIEEAYIYVMADKAELMEEELTRVRHSSVNCERVPLDSCCVKPRFQELSGSVASERLDAILAMIYHLSRGRAQELVERELVVVDGQLAGSAGLALKEGQKVSVRGHGKFLYLGTGSVTKKGRVYAKVKLYV